METTTKKTCRVMLDLETLGANPNALIATVGACAIVDGKLRTFYNLVNMQSAQTEGFQMDVSTVLWWISQDAAAKSDITRTEYRDLLIDVLCNFNDFISSLGEDLNLEIWSCGSDFDTVILANAYRKICVQQPWKFYQTRCYRTMKEMFPEVAKPPREGAHNALNDAIFQLDHLNMILAHIETLKA